MGGRGDGMKECELSKKIQKYGFSVDGLNFEPLSSEIDTEVHTPEKEKNK